MTAAPEIPHDQQLAAAQAVANHATQKFAATCEAMHAARGAYTLARASDPADQTTDDARQAWAEAAHDLVDAHVAMEQARDEVTAIHRQSAEYAITEETTNA
ncbi:hypothetical protein GCM10022254_09440 [Actinomadura meridiana]|uniref:ESX-1 secretion-associated protein n=1 Tax=Actinomadura meridiana TaxID=559626 RepID=A0ABP8BTV7_9ACTN